MNTENSMEIEFKSRLWAIMSAMEETNRVISMPT